VAPADGREPQEETGEGVSGRVEASRRHGPFDSRWLKRLRLVAPVRVAPALADLKPAGLDWDAFLSHFYPGGRRHDPEAIKAYFAYRHGREAVEVHPQGAQTREADEPAVLIAMEASSDSPARTPSTSR
jgi:hypothetical protein